VLAVEIKNHVERKNERNQLVTSAIHDLKDAWRDNEKTGDVIASGPAA
jgi:hypothetical protein